MKSKLLIICTLMFILSTFFVLAAQPTVTVPQTASAENLILVYPKTTAYKANQGVDLHLHVYNATGFMLNNASSGGVKFCTIHFYNSTNNHLLQENLTFNGVEWEREFSAQETKNVGEYPYTIWCEMRNKANGAGFVSGTVFFTEEGVSLVTPEALPALTFIVLFVVGTYILLGLTWEFNLTGKNKINAIKLFFVWLVIWLIPLVTQIGLNMAIYQNSSSNNVTLFTTLYTVTMTAAILLSAYFGIYILYNILLSLGMVTKGESK
jgi:hypothetical protein